MQAARKMVLRSLGAISELRRRAPERRGEALVAALPSRAPSLQAAWTRGSIRIDGRHGEGGEWRRQPALVASCTQACPASGSLPSVLDARKEAASVAG